MRFDVPAPSTGKAKKAVERRNLVSRSSARRFVNRADGELHDALKHSRRRRQPQAAVLCAINLG
jgi:hypothetical protein